MQKVSRKLLLAACIATCAVSMHSLYAESGVLVVNKRGDMQQFGYQVQACEDANQNNCTASFAISADQPVELVLDKSRTSRRSGRGFQENIVPIKAYDLLFFAERAPGLMEQVATLEDVRPGSTVECHDGRAFVHGNARKYVRWTPVPRMRQSARRVRPKLVRLAENASVQDLETEAERLDELARELERIHPANITPEERQDIVFYRAQATELRRQAAGRGLGEALLDRPAPSVELEQKNLELKYPTTEAFDMM